MEPSEETPPLPTPPWRRAALLLLQWGVVAAALWLTWRLVRGIGWDALAARVGQASWPALALAIALLFGRFAVWDLRFRLAAARALERRPQALLGFFVLLASAALNLVTPSARVIGGMMRARYYARAAGRPFGLLYGVVLFDQVAHHAVMTIFTWLALAVTALALGYRAIGWATLAALGVALLGLALWSRRRRDPLEASRLVRFLARRAERQDSRLQRVFAHGHEAAGVFVRLLGDTSLRGPALLLGFTWFLMNAFALWFVFRALGKPVGVPIVFSVVALGNAAGMLTGTPGGVGTTEAAMVASFVALGLDRVDAGAATLLFRGLHYAVVLAAGIPALLFLELRRRPSLEEGKWT